MEDGAADKLKAARVTVYSGDDMWDEITSLRRNASELRRGTDTEDGPVPTETVVEIGSRAIRECLTGNPDRIVIWAEDGSKREYIEDPNL